MAETEPNLEELIKLAGPALRHAELVTYAREETPNRAHQLAMTRWPQREAKACRELAKIRRDHPQAFERLTNPPTEHVRPDNPVRNTLGEETHGRNRS
jgi:hypothetical protein